MNQPSLGQLHSVSFTNPVLYKGQRLLEGGETDYVHSLFILSFNVRLSLPGLLQVVDVVFL